MQSIHIRGALKAGWQAFTRRPWYLLGLLLAFVVVFVISLGNALVSALAYIAYGGYLLMLLKHLRGDEIKLDDMFTIDSRWISFAFLGIIKTLLILLGLLCFIIPGVYLAIRWLFAELLVLDQGLRPLEALKASSALTAGVRGKLFLFCLVGCLLMILVTPLILIGWLVVSLVFSFATMQLYENLRQRSDEETVVIDLD